MDKKTGYKKRLADSEFLYKNLNMKKETIKAIEDGLINWMEDYLYAENQGNTKGANEIWNSIEYEMGVKNLDKRMILEIMGLI